LFATQIDDKSNGENKKCTFDYSDIAKVYGTNKSTWHLSVLHPGSI